MKWLWVRKNGELNAWSLLPDTCDRKVEAMFQASITIEVGDGSTMLIWMDKWIDGQRIDQFAPCLVQAVRPAVKKRQTVRDALENRNWIRDITGALTVQVLLEYLDLWERLQLFNLTDGTPDKVLWKWTTDRSFSTSSAYSAFFLGQYAVHGVKNLWKTRAPAKCKFFLWLAIHERCWTAERRKRHNLQVVDTCALCDQEAESITHLLIGCSFSRQIWLSLLLHLGLQQLCPTGSETSLAYWWLSSRKQLGKHERRGFDSLVILISWMIWKERNARNFNNQAMTVVQLRDLILEELSVWVQAGFKLLSVFCQALGHAPGRVAISV